MCTQDKKPAVFSIYSWSGLKRLLRLVSPSQRLIVPRVYTEVASACMTIATIIIKRKRTKLCIVSFINLYRQMTFMPKSTAFSVTGQNSSAFSNFHELWLGYKSLFRVTTYFLQAFSLIFVLEVYNYKIYLVVLGHPSILKPSLS